MGQEYRETLETSTDPTFWRGLIDHLDSTAISGRDEEDLRHLDFTVFGKKRKRLCLTTEPQSETLEQGKIDFADTKRAR